jgi:hypothetical protein
MKSALKSALAKYQGAEFRYGVLDCGLFVANVLKDVMGKDFANPWRGQYDSEIGALRLVLEHKDLAGLATAAFGPKKPIWTARPGSPVLLNSQSVDQDSIGQALGIFDGDQVYYLTAKGLGRAPILSGVVCWHV